MTRKRLVLTAGGAVAAAVLLAGGGAVLVLRSDWLHEKIRGALISTLETSTGGRAEIGAFTFDWRTMRLEAGPVVLHGNEPSGKPPLLRAASVTAGLKVRSFFSRDVRLESLDVRQPSVYLIVGADGRTNVPEPRLKPRGAQTPLDTLLDLAVARFSLQQGDFVVEGRSRTPFEARGRNLQARFAFEPGAIRYRGDLSIQTLDVPWNGQPVPVGVQMALTLAKDRIEVSSARLTTGDSRVDFSGSLQDLVSPRASFRYQARASAADLSRLLRLRGLERGAAELAGTADWAGGTNYSLAGSLRVSGVELRAAPWQLSNGRAEGALRVTAAGAKLSGLRFSGEAIESNRRLAAEGVVADTAWRGRDLDLRSVSLDVLGGRFTGDVQVSGYDRFQLSGAISGLDARRAVAVYNRAALPWDSRVSGPVTVTGSLRQSGSLNASVRLTLAPAPDSPPVNGTVAAVYNASDGVIKFEPTVVALPSSRAEIAGVLGRQMQLRLETHDLNDFLPVLGGVAPVRFQNGSARFDGTVTGPLDAPVIEGRLSATRFVYARDSFDELQAELTASPDRVRLGNASLARGTSRAQFQLALGLRNWKMEDAAGLAGSGTVRNGSLPDLLALAGITGVRATGIVNGSAQVSGTVGNPQLSGQVEAAGGSLEGEPFDRFTAELKADAFRWQMTAGQWTAGSKQVRLEGSFEHEPGRLDAGRVRFQVQSNLLPLAEIRTLAQARPGIQGTLQIAATGAVDLLPAGSGAARIRLSALQTDISARGLRLAGRPLGDAHLSATSQGVVLRAHLDGDFATSMVRGDGQWRLEGEYPGDATLTFSRLDLAGLKDWIAPSNKGAASPVAGFADGEIQVSGPLAKPALLKAGVRIPTLEVRPSSAAGSFTFRNSGPIVASLANSVLTIDSAKLTGPSTELAVTGKISLAERNPLDVRVNGHINLAVLSGLNPDIQSSGEVTADAAISGPLGDPQVNGKLTLADASVSYSMFPNGISGASGAIVFTGDRAAIQNLTGETGGGKIQLTGFATYDKGPAVFGLRADAQGVRVRYPEGVSTVADASLNLTGTSERSMLAGTVTIRRTSLNLESDFNSLLAKSAEPVRTAAAGTGLLAGLNYDVQIQTAPDIQFESALTQGLQADANLRLRGTVSNPALLGRVNITQGQLVFFGTKYNINQGTISFVNPVKVDPVLNVDLETRARGIDITLTVSGPMNKLTMSPRSDPPLQSNEILSVLTTGQNPTTDNTTRVGQQSPTTAPLQQTTATAMLGQVITSPVSGRLQRFFGISKLRIDPTLPGIEYNPQARLTLEQQVTPDITFTYITNVTSANPQVVSVEWALSKRWSVVAQREENGLLGLDFFFKKRFK